MPLSLLSLFLAAFSIGTTEYVVAGLLPEISRDLAVSIPAAGLLVTGYAIGVALGGPFMTLITSRFARKVAITGLMAIFIGGHILCALAPTYELMMAARIFISLSHGSFFGLAAIIAVAIAAPGKSGAAISLVFAGLTIATILGVPLGTTIGNAWGWRATFWVIAALAVLSTLAMAALLPAGVARQETRVTLASQVRVLLRPSIYVSFALMIVMATGFFSFFTFVAPFFTDVSGAPRETVAWLLLLFGLGSTTGIFLGGRLADTNPRLTLLLGNPIQAVIYVALLLLGGNLVAASILLFAFGAAAMALFPTLQNRVLRLASDAPDLASTLINTAFNTGVALGASLGAITLTYGLNYAQLPWIGLAAALFATALAILATGIDRRDATAAVAT